MRAPPVASKARDVYLRLLYFVLALSVACCLVTAPMLPVAAAQGEATTQESARELFEEGVALANSERWAEALSAFRGSAELVPRPSTSYNIANALYRLDRPVEGLEELDKFEAMTEVLLNKAARERGATLRGLLESAVAEVRLAITPTGADVFVDGRLSAGTGFEREIRLNPGPHSIRITHDGYKTSVREIRVERGSRQAQTIALQPLTPSTALAVAVAPPSVSLEPNERSASSGGANEDDRKRFVKRPGFWVMIAAIAAVGVGTGVAVALLRKVDAPQCGTTGSCATTQGLTVTSF